MSIEEMFKIGIGLRNSGESKKAVTYFESIINLYPNHPKISAVYTILAGIYSDLGSYHEAKTYFNEATRLNPKSEAASLGLYICLVELGNSEGAILEMKRYLDANAADLYRTTLGELLEGLRDGYMKNYEDLIYALARKHGIAD